MPTRDTPTITQAWERQPGESPEAYRGFQAYLNQPPQERNIREAYRQVYGKPTATQAAGYFSNWAISHRWRARAQEWDNMQARVQHEARLKVIAENAAKWERRRQQIAEDDFNDAQRLRERTREIMALPVVQQTLTESVESPDGRTIINNFHVEPLKVRAADAALMLRLASDRQRLAAEMATQIIETVTPESRLASRLAEARKAMQDGLAKFGSQMAEVLAADLSAVYSQPNDGIIIQPEDLLPAPDVSITEIGGIQ